MSNESIPDCIVHKDSRNIQVRLDYMLLYRNETKAKIIRTMETWTNQKRADWYKLCAESKEPGVEFPQEPPEEALWVTMSYEEFSIYAYGTMNHDSIKQNVDALVEHEHLKRRPHPDVPYGPPQYLLDTQLLQAILNDQEMPSLFDDIGKIRPPRKKRTPQVKYPQGGGKNTLGDGVKIPPPWGENTPPSNNTTKNYRELPNNKDTYATSSEVALHTSNVSDIEVMRKRKTEPRIPAVHLTIDTPYQYHIATDGYEKGQTDAGTIDSSSSIDHRFDNDNRGLLARDENSLRSERLSRQERGQGYEELVEDFDADAHEREMIEAFLNADTVKVQAIKSDQLVNNRAQSQPSLSSQSTLQANSGNVIKTPDAGVPLSLAADPPSRQDDAASGQAVSSGSPSGVDAAQRTITAPNGAVQASIPKRPRAKKAVTQAKVPAITLTEQQQAFWALWCAVWFNVDIAPSLNETAYGHVKTLAPHITTQEQMNSLEKHARKRLLEQSGISRKEVQLGNCANSYQSWIQTQQQAPKPQNGPVLGGYYLLGEAM